MPHPVPIKSVPERECIRLRSEGREST